MENNAVNNAAAVSNNTAANNGPVMKGIKNSWSLLAFAKLKGRMQVGEFTNSETSKVFKSCIFTDPNDSSKRTFVAFASKLGELTPQQIAERKNNLQVVELEGGHYSLCSVGSNSWQDVDLDI